MYLFVKLLHPESIDWAILRLISDAILGAVIYIIVVISLWVLSGRPQGVEHMCINLVDKKLKSFVRLIPIIRR